MPQDRSFEAQAIAGPLTTAATFLVVTILPGRDHAVRARDVIAEIGDLVRAVGFRSLHGNLTCAVGIGSDAWDRIGTGTRPAQLHDFVPLSGVHEAPATPGDLLFHIRAERADLCFELERLLLDQLGDAVEVADVTHGFRYFDTRDLLGFVDGTENPTGREREEAALIGSEDPAFAGGSYAVVQKYTHDLTGWQQLATSEQEQIIGRTKLDDVEIDDEERRADSHVTLNTITDDAGVERDVLRGNMPFGSPGSGEVGLYYIAYARDLWVTEKMLENMFIGDPPGAYDKILDFSTAVTGTNFFVPSRELLESLAEGDVGETEQNTETEDVGERAEPSGDGSLGIASLKGEYGHG